MRKNGFFIALGAGAGAIITGAFGGILVGSLVGKLLEGSIS